MFFTKPTLTIIIFLILRSNEKKLNFNLEDIPTIYTSVIILRKKKYLI
jgi:hypothetical protein